MKTGIVYEYQVIYRLANSSVYNITSSYYKDKDEFKERLGPFIFVELYKPSRRERK